MTELSVIVPTFRRPALLRRCLASLAEQDAAPERFEVIVVDDGSGDDTARVTDAASAALRNLRALRRGGNRGPAAARNLGISEARGDLLLLLDDDIVATPGLVSTHLRLHAGSGDRRTGFLGLVEWHPELRVTEFMRWVDLSGLQFGYDTWIERGAIDPPYAAFYACNLSLRRELVEEVGGFDERFPFPAYEDMELAWRLTEQGFRLRHAPEALAYHGRPIDLETFRRRMSRVGESAVLLRAVQPGFPLDERAPAGWVADPRTRWALRAAAPLARLAGDRARLERHFRAEVAAAYLAGRRRGERLLRQRLARPKRSGAPAEERS